LLHKRKISDIYSLHAVGMQPYIESIVTNALPYPLRLETKGSYT